MDDAVDIIWKALSDPTRRGILDRLSGGAETTGDLAAAFPDLSRYAVMKHLDVLEHAGLVVVRREGRKRWNHLNAVPLRRVYERWVGKFADHWAGALLRLEEHAIQPTEETSAMTTTSVEPRTIRIESSVEIAAPRQRVFDALTRETESWFWPGKVGTRNPPSKLEPWVGGRFWRDESASKGEGAGELYATIATIKPPEYVRMVGDFASEQAYAGVITIRLEAKGADKTRVLVTHTCSGDVPEDKVREFDDGWRDELGNLKRYVEGA
ncbi:MAG: helix-turn-helix domain-containing protein [Phycisphaerales bacterium]